jgi:beta-lactamase superfamily II metal-dependent hydrolase
MLKCDLLKMGHHAGANATGVEWLDAIAPQAAIACMPQWLSLDERGKRVEAMLKERNIPFFRSWEFPDAVIFSDGKTFGIYTRK